MADLLLIHAREFTTIEVQGLTIWNSLQDAGIKQLAQDVLDAILMHEHYTSLLDNDVSKRTAQQNTQQTFLQTRAQDLIQQGVDALQAAHVQTVQLLTPRISEGTRPETSEEQ